MHIHIHTYMHTPHIYMYIHTPCTQKFAQCMHLMHRCQTSPWVPPTGILLYDNASTHTCTCMCTYVLYVYTQNTYDIRIIPKHTQRPAQKPFTLNCFEDFQIMHTHSGKVQNIAFGRHDMLTYINCSSRPEMSTAKVRKDQHSLIKRLACVNG